MPEVAVYEGEPNAFATGAFRNSALVAVSTGLLGSMSHEEIEAVLGHEIAHVANGDMVTLTLIQGVVNTFVVFLSRVVAFFVDRIVFRTERGTGPGYFITMIVSQILLGILASIIVAWFSRRREFRADAGSAQYLGTPQPMIHALARLGGLPPGELPKSLSGFGITDRGAIASLFATHPPIEARIRALQGRA
jgi:heat shock protein HtpX